MTVYH